MRRKLTLKKTTCLSIGMAGAAFNIICGTLMAFGVGQALYARTAAVICYGAMLCIMGVLEKGDENKTRRAKLLLLVIALVIGYTRLPILDLTELLVLPIFTVMYKDKNQTSLVVFIALFEIAYAVIRTIALVPRFVWGAPLLVSGSALIVVGVVRGLTLLCLRKSNRIQHNRVI